jgi:hypothetical protein
MRTHDEDWTWHDTLVTLGFVAFTLLLILLLTSCDKMTPAQEDYLCGNPITWYNHTGCEVLIEIDTCNTTFHMYADDSVTSTAPADPLGQCYHSMPYKAYIMIDGREWVFRQAGYVEDANEIK